MKRNAYKNLGNEPIFPISVAARMAGVSASTLRIYEAQGLLIPFKTKKMSRLYSTEDLDWINYIRFLIKHEKLSINGIRRLLALIPCWKIKNCSDTERNICAAYVTNHNPCWTLSNGNGTCKKEECRLCEVYKDARQAFDTKKMLAAYTNY